MVLQNKYVSERPTPISIRDSTEGPCTFRSVHPVYLSPSSALRVFDLDAPASPQGMRVRPPVRPAAGPSAKKCPKPSFSRLACSLPLLPVSGPHSVPDRCAILAGVDKPHTRLCSARRYRPSTSDTSRRVRNPRVFDSNHSFEARYICDDLPNVLVRSAEFLCRVVHCLSTLVLHVFAADSEDGVTGSEIVPGLCRVLTAQCGKVSYGRVLGADFAACDAETKAMRQPAIGQLVLEFRDGLNQGFQLDWRGEVCLDGSKALAAQGEAASIFYRKETADGDQYLSRELQNARRVMAFFQSQNCWL